MHVPWDASLGARFRCASGRAELRNVLRAFARRVPAVRYCQGLNFIAALLLVVFQNEARSKRGQVLKRGGGKPGRKIETVCIPYFTHTHSPEPQPFAQSKSFAPMEGASILDLGLCFRRLGL